MKKAANILYLVGAIFAFISTATLLITGVILLVWSGPNFTAQIIDGINNGTIHTSFVGTVEQIAAQIQALFVLLGTPFLVIGVFSIVSGFLALRGRNTNGKGIFIANIVFAVLSGNDAILVASIFALIKGDTIEAHVPSSFWDSNPSSSNNTDDGGSTGQ